MASESDAESTATRSTLFASISVTSASSVETMKPVNFSFLPQQKAGLPSWTTLVASDSEPSDKEADELEMESDSELRSAKLSRKKQLSGSAKQTPTKLKKSPLIQAISPVKLATELPVTGSLTPHRPQTSHPTPPKSANPGGKPKIILDAVEIVTSPRSMRKALPFSSAREGEDRSKPSSSRPLDFLVHTATEQISLHLNDSRRSSTPTNTVLASRAGEAKKDQDDQHISAIGRQFIPAHRTTVQPQRPQNGRRTRGQQQETVRGDEFAKAMDVMLDTKEAPISWGFELEKGRAAERRLRVNLRFIARDLRENPTRDGSSTGPGFIQCDPSRTVTFVERLEEMFGPGDVRRGSRRKDAVATKRMRNDSLLKRPKTPVSEASRSVTPQLDPSRPTSPPPTIRQRTKRARSPDVVADSEDEARSSKPKKSRLGEENRQQTSLADESKAAQIAERISKVVKGKTATTPEDLQNLRDELDNFDPIKGRLDAETLKDSLE
ncbi:hypothetical protein JAAARDRAFT_75427 [Jaapia argillacea MUCL 33604]|uniref:Uncharacterized protein n=1 Tax=Jaapia argillacea MUCL 33604 TaxID=933084 RepID=A0A067QQV4_9AGAM|nr:hypothetical protein JAAARDRAFT_75427 [Jaapia argillacea MUCL 33604]